MHSQFEVLVRRGAITESRHRIEAAVCDAGARIVDATTHPERVTTWRSAAKPFQVLPLVERGHVERWGFDDAQLAMMAASHIGSPEHIAIVRSILERIGRRVDDLACGYHDPPDPTSLEAVRADPGLRTAIYNNCSGKHAGMIAMALAEGWPVEGYHHADHPLQRLIQRTVAEVTGIAERELQLGIDGCGVPVFGLPLTAMATAYARLASARADGDPRQRAMARIRDTMSAHPYLTEGRGRFSSELMAATGGRLVAKVGAEGLECIAWPERALGMALKTEDGAPRATEPAVVTLLEHLGALGDEPLAKLERFRRPRLTNVVGRDVGWIEARLRAPTPLA